MQQAICTMRRDRSHATDFTAALSDHMGYLRRQQEARQMQEAYRAAQDGQQGPNLPTLDFSLKPGETVSLKLADKVGSRGGTRWCCLLEMSGVGLVHARCLSQ
jgi:hypothetical protein